MVPPETSYRSCDAAPPRTAMRTRTAWPGRGRCGSTDSRRSSGAAGRSGSGASTDGKLGGSPALDDAAAGDAADGVQRRRRRRGSRAPPRRRAIPPAARSRGRCAHSARRTRGAPCRTCRRRPWRWRPAPPARRARPAPAGRRRRRSTPRRRAALPARGAGCSVTRRGGTGRDRGDLDVQLRRTAAGIARRHQLDRVHALGARLHLGRPSTRPPASAAESVAPVTGEPSSSRTRDLDGDGGVEPGRQRLLRQHLDGARRPGTQRDPRRGAAATQRDRACAERRWRGESPASSSRRRAASAATACPRSRSSGGGARRSGLPRASTAKATTSARAAPSAGSVAGTAAEEQPRKRRQRQIDVAPLLVAELVDGEAGRVPARRHHQRHAEVAVGAHRRRRKFAPVDGDGHASRPARLRR